MAKECGKEEKRYTVIHIPVDLLEKNGKTKNALLIEILEKGLEKF